MLEGHFHVDPAVVDAVDAVPATDERFQGVELLQELFARARERAAEAESLDDLSGYVPLEGPALDSSESVEAQRTLDQEIPVTEAGEQYPEGRYVLLSVDRGEFVLRIEHAVGQA